MITKHFVIVKDLYTYTMIFLRQDKILRDHGDELSTGVIGMTDEARAMTWRWP
jgi:hypothetical protein